MVKCSECGFLALRDKTTGLLVEANDDYRASGRVPEYIAAYKEYHNYPICFAMAYDLMPEVEQAAQQQFINGSDDWGKYTLGVINKERVCPPHGKSYGFTTWQQGFTPKEHREMLERQWMRQREDKRDADIREWQERQRKSDRRWRIIEGIVFVLLAGGFTVLGALISRGSIP